MAADRNGACRLDLGRGHTLGCWPWTRVIDVKRRISSNLGVEVGRLTLYVMPRWTKMEDHRTVASYGIRAGETALLDLQIEPIGVMVHFVGTPNLSYPIEYDERVATVEVLKRLIVAQLKKTGVEDIGPEDMELRLGDVKLDNPRAALRDYGVENASVILVSTAKAIVLRRRPTASAL